MKMPIRASIFRAIGLCAILSIFLAGSGYAQKSIKQVVYPKMYEESPAAILMRPIT